MPIAPPRMLIELFASKVGAVDELQNGVPQLTTVAGVQIIKTGIEYPLSSGPTTFTPEDLADAVAAQDDPAIPQPRIWLGHFNDERIHGKRSQGLPSSGEPALGKVTNMRLEDEGNTIVGDLTGVPIWFANIMGSAFPSRSIEGLFNFKTVTGKTWRLVISGLAMLGVVWPGVTTIEDIASLFTEEGPDVHVTTATKEQPVAVTAALDRLVKGQVTVEDLRRQWYSECEDDKDMEWWWIRAIYIDPNELIVDADDEGALYRVPFVIDGETVTFSDPTKVKIKYVNASHGGVEALPVNENRTHVALFESREEGAGDSLDIKLSRKSVASSVEIKLGGKK